MTTHGIDIALSTTKIATISGSAIDASGLPLRRGNVMLIPRNPAGMIIGPHAAGPIKDDGAFTISNVAPGEYTVRATIMPSAPGMPPEELTASVSVEGADVTGVIVRPTRPIRVTGHITLDPAGTWVEAAAIHLMLQPRNPDPMFSGGRYPPVTRDDFTFELTSGAGVVLLRAFPSSSRAMPWSVKSVRYNGREIIDSGLELSDGQDLDGVEIVLTNRQQLVTGLVTNAKGELVLDASVIFFPQNPEEWIGPTRHAGSGRPDQNGRYAVRALPPGDYFAVAIGANDNSRRALDPRQFYDDLSRLSTSFTLTEGETRIVDLRLVVQP
jgi:hypothetical protein